MSAVVSNIVEFQSQDQRKVCVLPFRAAFDPKLTHGGLQVLAALCAFCNKSGVTWVSQTRLAKDIGITQQAVAKQFKQLRDLGYLETVCKGFKGKRTDTLRVIFDADLTTEEPTMTDSEEQDSQPEQVDRQGLARIAQLIAKGLRQPRTKKEASMPKQGESLTVRKMKADIEKAQAKRTKRPPIHNPQVVIEDTKQAVDNSLHSQPNHNLEVVHNTENIGLYKEVNIGMNTHEVNHACVREAVSANVRDACIKAGMTEAQVSDCAVILLPLFAAEGFVPSDQVLTNSIIFLHQDTA